MFCCFSRTSFHAACLASLVSVCCYRLPVSPNTPVVFSIVALTSLFSSTSALRPPRPRLQSTVVEYIPHGLPFYDSGSRRRIRPSPVVRPSDQYPFTSTLVSLMRRWASSSQKPKTPFANTSSTAYAMISESTDMLCAPSPMPQTLRRLR